MYNECLLSWMPTGASVLAMFTKFNTRHIKIGHKPSRRVCTNFPNMSNFTRFPRIQPCITALPKHIQPVRNMWCLELSFHSGLKYEFRNKSNLKIYFNCTADKISSIMCEKFKDLVIYTF